MDTSKKEINERIEIALITNFLKEEDTELLSNVPDAVKDILTGQYKNVIHNELPDNLIELLNVSDNIQGTMCNIIQTEIKIQDSWLCLGIASLLYFVQCNWTGPRVNENTDWMIIKQDEALKNLSLHDECNENVTRPELLYVAKCIFSNNYLQSIYESCSWWLFRANFIHQFVLEENSGILFEETQTLVPKINELKLLKNAECKTLFNLEVAQFLFLYRCIQNSEQHLEIAQTTAGLVFNLQGIMGKRTKYQQEEKPQLFLEVQLQKDPFQSRKCNDVPKSLDLNDDLRLEHIEFSEYKDKIKLGAMEEAVLLAKYVQLQLSQPKDKLTDEEIKPYLTSIIDSTKSWSLKSTSLCHRCILESDDKRTVERSMTQAEYLLQNLFNSKVPVTQRIDVLFASGMKPIWRLEQMWANLMIALGLVKGALDVFIKLRLWEDVIQCYNLLDLKHKAAEIIQQEISKRPTVKLWCLLGDATQNVTHYETAWNLSAQKSSRAQRHWGIFYFEKKDYHNAIPHLKLSVELNNIQENVWLKLGFAALQTEDWKLAAMAYRRYCSLEPMTFEAWNNLAKAYIKLGDKQKAWKALQDAIRCNYDRWEVWDNFMVVSIDLGHFSEVIRCYHRILDLKNQHSDVEVLNILVNAIRDNIIDADGHPSRRLLRRGLELFGRVTSSIPNNPDIWRIYAQLTSLEETDISYQKSAQYLQNAHRAAVSNPQWFQTEDTTKNVLELCYSLGETYLRNASVCSEFAKKRALLGSAKLSLQGIITKVKTQQWNNSNIFTSLEKVEKCFQTIIDELEKIKGN